MITTNESERTSGKTERVPEIDLGIVILDDPELTKLFRDQHSEVLTEKPRVERLSLRYRPYEFD